MPQLTGVLSMGILYGTGIVGVSQRGKDRPNQIGMTSVEIQAVDDKKDSKVPEWVDRLMEHYF